MEAKTNQPQPAPEFRFSEFSNVRSKCAINTNLAEFYGKLTSDLYRQPVEAYRRLKATDSDEAIQQAQAIKSRMPCITPAATCFGGHAVSDLRQLSGLLCIDLDHTDQRTDEIRRLAAGLPWVVLVFTSISGQGVKLLVRIRPELLEAQGWATLYAAVGEAVSRHVGHAYDAQCKALTQPCYYSWDPDAYYNPYATCFEWTAPEQAMPATTAATPIGTTANAAETPATPEAPGFIERFIQQFEQENPFNRGARNDVSLRLGRACFYKGFSTKEVEEVVRRYAERHAAADFTEKDIRDRVIASYQHIAKNPRPVGKRNRCQNGVSVTYDTSSGASTLEEPGEVYEKNNALRAASPCLPEQLFPLLPRFLQQCTEHATDARERDLMLLCALTCCSALFPKVRFFYKDRYYSPHLYLAAVAPVGTGKGVLSVVSNLLDRTHEHYEQQNREMRRRYEEQEYLWCEEVRTANKEKRKPDHSLKPDELRPYYFKLPSTTSKSRFIESLANADERGCIMISTEIATLTGAFRQDYGNFEDILLKAFHHEEVSSSFKTDGMPKISRHPRLSVCLSGTQEQFTTLFGSLESGLYSRFMFYTRPQELRWQSCAPDAGNTDLATHFRQLGETLFEMHSTLLQSPTLVSFSKRQWESHTATFSALLRQAELEEQEATSGIILRCGLQVMRIAATLTLFRKWDDYRYAPEYICTDDDFQTALQLALTTLEHSRLLSTSLPVSKQAPVAMHNPHRMEDVLNSLPSKFSYMEFVHQAMEQGVSEASGKRWIRKAIKLQFIVKEGNTYIKISNPPENGVIGDTDTEMTPISTGE